MEISLSTILTQNSHWNDESFVLNIPTYKRRVFSKISSWLTDRPIIVLSGLRRTGKSTLLKQLAVQWYSIKKSSTKNICNFSFDTEDMFEIYSASALEKLLEYYFLQVKNIHPAKITEPVLIILDEIQNVKGWERILKSYYDLNNNIKFLLSGSSALNISDSTESLAGRILEFQITPLDFNEFLYLMDYSRSNNAATIQELLEYAPEVVTRERLDLFENFILIGGFPEAAIMFKSGKNIIDIQYYLTKSIVEKIIGKDFRRYFGLKSSMQDSTLFKILSYETGSSINISKLSEQIGLNEETLRKHLRVFEKTFLLNWLEMFDTKLRRRLKAHPKLYISSPCLSLAFLGETKLPTGSLTGHLVESYIFQRLKNMTTEVYFSRTTENKEVDFYCPKEKVLIESKYTPHISKGDIDSTRLIAKKFKITPLIVSHSSWGEMDLKFIPACFF